MAREERDHCSLISILNSAPPKYLLSCFPPSRHIIHLLYQFCHSSRIFANNIQFIKIWNFFIHENTNLGLARGTRHYLTFIAWYSYFWYLTFSSWLSGKISEIWNLLLLNTKGKIMWVFQPKMLSLVWAVEMI